MVSTKALWISLGIYLLYLLVVGGLVNKTMMKKKEAYDLMKTTISWPMLVMTYAASLMSVWVFFAGPGGYYRGGMGYYLSDLSDIPLFTIICHFVMNKVWLINRKKNYITPSDFFYDRYKSQTFRVITGLIFLATSFPYVTSVVAAISQAATIATGGAINYRAVLLLVGLVMVIFTSIGGFKSVAITDTLQGIMFTGVLWAIVFVAIKFTYNGSLVTAIKDVWVNSNEWFSYPGPQEWVPYAARLGYPLSCTIGWAVMLPHVFVRAGYASDSMESQRKLAYLGPVMQVIIWTGTCLIGMVALAKMPGLTDADTELIIPYLLQNIVSVSAPNLASAMMILFVIGAIAVGVSTADSFLLVAASIVYDDFLVGIFNIKNDDKKRILYCRIVIALVGLICVLLALDPPKLIFTLIMFSIALVMPLFPVLVYGLYWKRATNEAAIVSTIVGTVLVLMTYYVWNLGDTWYGIFGMIAATVLMPVVSLMTKPDLENAEHFMSVLKESTQEVFEAVQ